MASAGNAETSALKILRQRPNSPVNDTLNNVDAGRDSL